MFSSIITKRKKLILLILIVFGVLAIFIFTVVSQKKTSTVSGDTIIMFNDSKDSLLDKELAQRTQLQKRLQESINTLEEVDTSTVTITSGNKAAVPTATVVIKLVNGKTLTDERQAAIKKLVHGSKNDILEENITLSIN